MLEIQNVSLILAFIEKNFMETIGIFVAVFLFIFS